MATIPAERTNWYDAPRYYDIVFDVDTAHEADYLVRVAEQHGIARTRRVLEPACGSGRLVAELARRGMTVTGFDLSDTMLAYARRRLRRRALRARLVCADMSTFNVGSGFQLAHCLVSTFKYLLDEHSARAHLERVARALEPGGLYVIGIHLTSYARTRPDRERWVERRRSTTVTCNTQVGAPDRRTRLEPVRTRLSVEGPRGTRKLETCWQFRTYDARQLRALVARVPAFEIAAVHDFTYDVECPRDLDDGRDDKVVVLRRR